VEPLRVLVVSPDPLARGGLAALLAAEPGIAVAGQAAPDRELPAAVRDLRPEVAAWDAGEGAAFAAPLREVAGGGLPVVAVLASPDQAAVALAAGALGLVFRESAPERLAAALAATARQLWAVEASLAPALLRPTARAEPPEPLTPRELEVLGLLAEGLANKAIAARLGISDHTAKFHVNAILAKLGAESRAEAIVRAARLGLVVL
jgi:DNA-binding NarL/FixJ family response regulator